MVECFHNDEELSQKKADKRAKEIAKGLAKERWNDESLWNHGGTPTNAGEKIYTKDIGGLQGLQKLLIEAGGPIYASYWNGKTGEDYSGHMVVVTGTDANWDNVYTNNPWGNKGKQSYDEFLNGFDTGFLGGDSGMMLRYVYMPVWEDEP